MKMKLSMVLILSGLLIGFGDFNGSSAMDSIVIDRQAELHTASSDDTALLAPIGFNNTNFILTTVYKTLGTIKNNTNQTLSLRFYMDPDITATKYNTTLYIMTMKMINSKGTTLKTLSFTGTGVLDMDPLWSGVTSIDAGATYTIQGKLTISARVGFVASVLYGFEGVGTNGLTINLQDTATNPRRQTYTAQ